MTSEMSRGATRIILMRHAEKTGEADDRDLSERGQCRAAILATALPAAFGQIDAIIAAKSSERSVRPLRTVEPLAIALGLAVLQNWDASNYSELASLLESDGRFNGQQVLICWRHKSIHKLAMALGTANISPWPETDYVHIVAIQRHPAFAVTWYRQWLDGKELTLEPVLLSKTDDPA